MAKYHGKNFQFYISDSAGSQRNISVGVNSIDLPSDQDIVDVAGFGDSKKNYVTGLADSKVTVKGQFDDTATTGSHAVLSGLVGGTTGYRLSAAPKGSAIAYPRFEGTYLLNKYNISAAINGAIMYDAEFVPFGTAGGSWGVYP